METMPDSMWSLMMLLVMLLAMTTSAMGQNNSSNRWSSLFQAGWPVNDVVFSLAVITSNNVWVGGSFFYHIVHFNGSTWRKPQDSTRPTGGDVLAISVNQATDMTTSTVHFGGSFNQTYRYVSKATDSMGTTSVTFTNVAANVDGSVYAMTRNDNLAPVIYLGGAFSAPKRNFFWINNTIVEGPSLVPNGPVYALLVMGTNGDSVVVAGEFTSPSINIAKWANGWSNFTNDGLNYAVFALAAGSGGTIYAGGRGAVSAWDGVAWTPLGGGFNGSVFSLVYDSSNDTLYAGGSFLAIAGEKIQFVAQWQKSASKWTPLAASGSDNTPNSTVYAMALSGELLFLGGAFTNLQYLATFNTTEPATSPPPIPTPSFSPPFPPSPAVTGPTIPRTGEPMTVEPRSTPPMPSPQATVAAAVSSSKSHSSIVGPVVGAIVALLVLLCIAVIIVIIVRRRQRRQQHHTSDTELSSADSKAATIDKPSAGYMNVGELGLSEAKSPYLNVTGLDINPNPSGASPQSVPPSQDKIQYANAPSFIQESTERESNAAATVPQRHSQYANAPSFVKEVDSSKSKPSPQPRPATTQYANATGLL
jgi:hypothetical protein